MYGSSEADDWLALEHQVCFTLAIASRDVISLYRPFLQPLGLTHPQYLVMLALWKSEPLSVRQLSALLKMDSPTLSPLLKRLEAAGLIERRRDPADERALRLTVTPRGRALREEAKTVPSSILKRLGMSVEELEALHLILTHVILRANARSTAG
jgi:DNA-binding MarR family transcriptional regulator